ncbi:probable F-box protein At5g04010 [Aristolochia californica]|uniref:probable F-box protein At5g04010 n=1 Tax=Aristolochia californica TaxID=171875 RepID=UPI0035DD50E8
MEMEINELPAGVLTKVMAPAREPPWEIVNLLSRHLEPKTLAIASCVSKSWSVPMSSDELWRPICLSRFPSLSALRQLHPNIPYRRLFHLAHSASVRPRLIPPPPRISLRQLFFAVDIFNESGSLIFSLVKPGLQVNPGPGEVFRFDIEVAVCLEEEMRVGWTVVLEGWKGVFSMMKGKSKGRTVISDGGELWFTEELPSAGCCVGRSTSGLTAEVGVIFGGQRGGSGKRMVEKLKLGLMSDVNCRYANLDEGLRYLQRFLQK